ncbi:MAG: efflux RND transporter periplasmic adaptor subunit [candidate division WOR-3 bacterium]|nr:efflux RND transporter periplasmic adaptor subunit [candidate division WOR-3 bacterium]
MEGVVKFPKNAITKIVPRFSGYVLNLYIQNEGEYINRGEKIFSFYSPEILRIKSEFDITKDSFILERIKLLQISPEDIFSDSIIFRSPISGRVLKIDITGGEKFEAGSVVMEIVNNSIVQFIGSVRKSDFLYVQKGDIVEIRNTKGRVVEILPSSNSANYFEIIVILKNDNTFFENNYEVGKIVKEIRGKIVPKSSVIRTGNSDIVYVFEDGSFKAKEVKIITDVKDGYLIEGIKNGEKIVKKGVFLIDADFKIIKP